MLTCSEEYCAVPCYVICAKKLCQDHVLGALFNAPNSVLLTYLKSTYVCQDVALSRVGSCSGWGHVLCSWAAALWYPVDSCWVTRIHPYIYYVPSCWPVVAQSIALVFSLSRSGVAWYTDYSSPCSEWFRQAVSTSRDKILRRSSILHIIAQLDDVTERSIHLWKNIVGLAC